MNSIHEDLIGVLSGDLASYLEGDPAFLYDGIKVYLKDGTELHIIYPTNDEYIFSWTKDGIDCKIDTAPLHKELGTSPNHFHHGDELKDDNITSTSNKPEENMKKVLDFIAD